MPTALGDRNRPVTTVSELVSRKLKPSIRKIGKATFSQAPNSTWIGPLSKRRLSRQRTLPSALQQVGAEEVRALDVDLLQRPALDQLFKR